MRLTLENAENKLIDLGLATRDEIEKQKEKRKFGQKTIIVNTALEKYS